MKSQSIRWAIGMREFHSLISITLLRFISIFSASRRFFFCSRNNDFSPFTISVYPPADSVKGKRNPLWVAWPWQHSARKINRWSGTNSNCIFAPIWKTRKAARSSARLSSHQTFRYCSSESIKTSAHPLRTLHGNRHCSPPRAVICCLPKTSCLLGRSKTGELKTQNALATLYERESILFNSFYNIFAGEICMSASIVYIFGE